MLKTNRVDEHKLISSLEKQQECFNGFLYMIKNVLAKSKTGQ